MGWFEHDDILDETPPPGLNVGLSRDWKDGEDCEECEELELDGHDEWCPFCSHLTACPECDD